MENEKSNIVEELKEEIAKTKKKYEKLLDLANRHNLLLSNPKFLEKLKKINKYNPDVYTGFSINIKIRIKDVEKIDEVAKEVMDIFSDYEEIYNERYFMAYSGNLDHNAKFKIDKDIYLAIEISVICRTKKVEVKTTKYVCPYEGE